jgi:hypothetical protein
VNPLAAVAAAASAPEAPGLSINFFWIIVAALNFIVFLALMWRFAFDPIANILAQRKTRIEQGLADAEQAHRDLAASASERDQMLVQRNSNGCASRRRPISPPSTIAFWPICGPRLRIWHWTPPASSSANR